MTGCPRCVSSPRPGETGPGRDGAGRDGAGEAGEAGGLAGSAPRSGVERPTRRSLREGVRGCWTGRRTSGVFGGRACSWCGDSRAARGVTGARALSQEPLRGRPVAASRLSGVNARCRALGDGTSWRPGGPLHPNPGSFAQSLVAVSAQERLRRPVRVAMPTTGGRSVQVKPLSRRRRPRRGGRWVRTRGDRPRVCLFGRPTSQWIQRSLRVERGAPAPPPRGLARWWPPLSPQRGPPVCPDLFESASPSGRPLSTAGSAAAALSTVALLSSAASPVDRRAWRP